MITGQFLATVQVVKFRQQLKGFIHGALPVFHSRDHMLRIWLLADTGTRRGNCSSPVPAHDFMSRRSRQPGKALAVPRRHKAASYNGVNSGGAAARLGEFRRMIGDFVDASAARRVPRRGHPARGHLVRKR
jgi:hypothetical protein